MGLRGYSSSAESQAGYNVRPLIVDRGFAEGGEVVWIDGSDFELELESVKAQARSPVAAPNKLEKGWFSRQGLSVCILPAHSCKRPMELSIMLAPGWQTSPPLDSNA